MVDRHGVPPHGLGLHVFRWIRVLRQFGFGACTTSQAVIGLFIFSSDSNILTTAVFGGLLT